MSDLVFSVGNVFSVDHREGVMGMEGVNRFYIAPYQRGYKWSSDSPSSPVHLMMTDFKESFDSNEPEYYLQYITVKKSSFNNENVLEVIDGQQRLTSLSLLFAVIAYKLNNAKINFTKDKLIYGIRSTVKEFFQNYIYNNIHNILEKDWDIFIKENPTLNEQDIFYLFHAVRKISSLLPTDNLNDFSDFVRDKVKIILNKVDTKVISERIFSDLNTNKVDLTNAELIKGLLLTKKAREQEQGYTALHFKEIMEIRSAMGRQWDEISRWVNRKDINSFFFSNSSDAMEKLLLFFAIKEGYTLQKSSDTYELFNFFQSGIKRGNKKSSDYFIAMKQLYSILKDWYDDTVIYNLLGYLFFAKESKFGTVSFLSILEFEKTKLIIELESKVNSLIPDNVEELEYKVNNPEIHRLLLALSVFLSEKRFDFYSFQNLHKGRWSLEHIFPQNPVELSDKLGVKDIALINKLIVNKKITKYTQYVKMGETEEQVKEIHSILKAKLKKESCEVSAREKEFLFEIMNKDKLNSIGNMALLLSNDNSSNSNGMFDFKRLNIVKKVSEGSFVPKHTYDVFSKLLSNKMVQDLTVWTEKDIEEHKNWIVSKINFIKEHNN